MPCVIGEGLKCDNAEINNQLCKIGRDEGNDEVPLRVVLQDYLMAPLNAIC